MKKDRVASALETDWDALAQEYFQRDFQKKDWDLGYTPLLELLGDVKGKRLLDYGCGSGKFSRVLAESGAEVIAVDPSKGMLELARSQDCAGILYRQIVDDDIGLIRPEYMDSAVSTYVLCGRSDDAQVGTTLQSIHKMLACGGCLFVLDPHPDTRKNRVEGIPTEHVLTGMSKPLYDYWRPKELYVELLTGAGFTLDDVLEPEDCDGNKHTIILAARKY